MSRQDRYIFMAVDYIKVDIYDKIPQLSDNEVVIERENLPMECYNN